MKTLNRCDLVPVCDANIIPRLNARAVKCGLKICDVLDVMIDGKQYKELLFSGSRWSYIKYMVVSMLKDGVEIGAIPGVIKLMLMR